MDLHAAATYFDDDPIYDGYTGAFLFTGQAASFDDSSSDGATARRRTISLAPGLSLPARQVVQMYGDRWVAGAATPDGWKGEVIRQYFNLKRVTNNLAVLTPAQALDGDDGTAVYAHKMYFKDTVNTVTDSEYDAQWNVFVAPGEDVVKGTFFRDELNRLYRVRNCYVPPEGLRVCQTDELDSDALQSAVFQVGGTYNPVTEQNDGASDITVNAIVVDTPKFFRYREPSDPAMLKGDITVFVSTGITPKTGDKFVMQDRNWVVLAVQAELDCWALHARGGV